METLADPTMAFEQLYQDFHQPIQRYLERLVGSREAAEDLAQETFIKALRCWDQHAAASVRGWLFRIAVNTAYDFLRRKRRIEFTGLTEAHYACSATLGTELHIDEAEQIQAALRQIPEHYRVPLQLIAAGYGHQDIATALGVNINTIKTRVHRARARFRQVYTA